MKFAQLISERIKTYFKQSSINLRKNNVHMINEVSNVQLWPMLVYKWCLRKVFFCEKCNFMFSKPESTYSCNSSKCTFLSFLLGFHLLLFANSFHETYLYGLPYKKNISYQKFNFFKIIVFYSFVRIEKI